MAVIFSKENNGSGKRRLGDVKVNSKNVSPDAVTAVATTGAQLDALLIQNYEFVNVTSANAANIVRLPGDCPVGTEINFYVGANGFRVLPKASSGELLNGGAADTNYIPIAANSRAVCFKDTPTHWTVHQIVNAGTLTAPSAV